MEYCKVRNWEKFQHYGHRNPPWIKFYHGCLDDPVIASLPDEQKAHLFGIWLLASRLGNKIPLDDDFVGRRINATKRVHLKPFIQMGLLECYQDASNLLADCKQDARPETEGETETETETETEGEGGAASATPIPAPANGRKRFTPPTLSEVEEFIKESGYSVDAEHWFAHYHSRGWKFSGGQPMQRWKSSIVTWQKREERGGVR